MITTLLIMTMMTMIADHDYCTEGNMEEEEVLEPKAFLTSLTPYTNFTITVAAFTK